MTVAPCPHCAASAWERTESATKPKFIEQPVEEKSNKGGSEAHRISSLCFPGPGIATRQNRSMPAERVLVFRLKDELYFHESVPGTHHILNSI